MLGGLLSEAIRDSKPRAPPKGSETWASQSSYPTFFERRKMEDHKLQIFPHKTSIWLVQCWIGDPNWSPPTKVQSARKRRASTISAGTAAAKDISLWTWSPSLQTGRAISNAPHRTKESPWWISLSHRRSTNGRDALSGIASEIQSRDPPFTQEYTSIARTSD